MLNPLSSTHEKVNDFWTNRRWDVEKFMRVVPLSSVHRIAAIPFDLSQDDKAWWNLDPTGAFTIKSAWNVVRQTAGNRPLLADFWSPNVRPTISIFGWRIVHNFLPVDARFKSKGVHLASKCPCCREEENLQHVFLNSEAIREVWGYFGGFFHITTTPDTCFITIMLQHWKVSTPFFSKGHVRCLIPLLIEPS
ncbi:UNVERIFIED_CONTAM: hypothetical protein Slati_2635600 [Sesamum latifolium]|uniref:Reverse transcriptase zinc-binding domain-containing protein n=1 Tax=Sesamum latifolium TaxID=2727402 RepID=A0AAW2VUB6_9LAMI